MSGARMWLEVGEKGDCMMDAMYKEQRCQCVSNQDVAEGRNNRG